MSNEALAAAVAEIAVLPVVDGFPAEALAAMGALGLLGLTVHPVSWSVESDAIRAVAAADGAVGTLFARHLDGLERVRLFSPDPTRHQVLEACAAGELLLWPDGAAVRGVPLPWCGHQLEQAVVLAMTPELPARSGLREACVWAGRVDAVAGEPGAPAERRGRLRVARRTLDLWLADAARRMDADPTDEPAELSALVRAAVARVALVFGAEDVPAPGPLDLAVAHADRLD